MDRYLFLGRYDHRHYHRSSTVAGRWNFVNNCRGEKLCEKPTFLSDLQQGASRTLILLAQECEEMETTKPVADRILNEFRSKNLNEQDLVALIVSHIRPASLKEMYLRWRTADGGKVTQKEIAMIEQEAGMEPGSLYPLVVRTGLAVVQDNAQTRGWTSADLDSICRTEQLHRHQHRKEVVTLKGQVALSPEALETLMEKYGFSGSGAVALRFAAELYDNAPTKTALEKYNASKKKDSHGLFTSKAKEDILEICQKYIRVVSDPTVAIWYMAAPTQKGGRLVRKLFSHSLSDEKGLYRVIKSLVDCQEIRQEERSHIVETYSRFMKYYRDNAELEGKLKTEPAPTEMSRIIHQFAHEIPIINEDSIKKVSWEDGFSEESPLAFQVLNKRSLMDHTYTLETVHGGNLEEYLQTYCPTWSWWMHWNGHRVGEYDSIGCFCLWLWKLCGDETGYHEGMRELFSLYGPGHSGNSAIAEALSKFLVTIHQDVKIGLSPHEMEGFVNKRFGVISENVRLRTVGDPVIKALTGGDRQTINPKGQPIYTAKIHMVLLSTSNTPLKMNYYENSERTRFYFMITKTIPKQFTRDSTEVVNGYVAEMYALLAYCKHMFRKHLDRTVGKLLDKPDDMVANIDKHCLTEASGHLRAYLEQYVPIAKEADFQWITAKKLREEIAKFNKHDDDADYHKDLKKAIDSAKEHHTFPLQCGSLGNGGYRFRAPLVRDSDIMKEAKKRQEQKVTFEFDL